MPKIRLIDSKSILVKSRLPEIDFVINPYTGCGHGCVYCYADFMGRFTKHREKWGKFVDVKVNAPEKLVEELNKINLSGKRVLIGSVTDPYQIVEKKYKITRKILRVLKYLDTSIDILTKSNLVLRDIALLKKIKNVSVGISMSVLDSRTARLIEPFSPSPRRRITALKKLHKSGIRTYLFHSPILPYLSETDKIIETAKDFVDFFMFENLNLKKQSVRGKFFSFLEKNFPNLTEKYHRIYSTDYYAEYWKYVENLVGNECKKAGKRARFFFHDKTS